MRCFCAEQGSVADSTAPPDGSSPSKDFEDYGCLGEVRAGRRVEQVNVNIHIRPRSPFGEGLGDRQTVGTRRGERPAPPPGPRTGARRRPFSAALCLPATARVGDLTSGSLRTALHTRFGLDTQGFALKVAPKVHNPRNSPAIPAYCQAAPGIQQPAASASPSSTSQKPSPERGKPATDRNAAIVCLSPGAL